MTLVPQTHDGFSGVCQKCDVSPITTVKNALLHMCANSYTDPAGVINAVRAAQNLPENDSAGQLTAFYEIFRKIKTQ